MLRRYNLPIRNGNHTHRFNSDIDKMTKTGMFQLHSGEYSEQGS